MKRSRITGGLAGLTTLVVFALVLVFLKPPAPGEARPADERPKLPRPFSRPIPMAESLVGLTVNLGLKDTEPSPWRGKAEVSGGKILEVEVARGGRPRVEGNTWQVRSANRRQNMRQVLVRPQVRISLDAPADAEVTLETPKGKFSFKLSDLTPGEAKPFLDGEVSVVRRPGALRLTTQEVAADWPRTEDDFPALARGKDGTVWLAYVEYQPGKPYVTERVLAGNFDTLKPEGNGDCVRLVRFDGKAWQPALDVTALGVDVWRPTVAVDGEGVVHVAWSQMVEGDWEVFTRRYTPGKEDKEGSWSEAERVTKAPGSDFHTVAAADSAGKVWLAWQAWRGDNFDILMTRLGEKAEPKTISSSKANDWGPAIAADGEGNVYVAWDTYDAGNYDVLLHRAGKEPKTWKVAHSAKFEARPSVACEGGRVWVAYEEGDEQWGKDFSTGQFKRIGLESNPGFALYINRTIKVKCLAGGELKRPGAQPAEMPPQGVRRGKSLPRLAVGEKGGLWLTFRHALLPGGGGEAWQSFALRYNGKTWSRPRALLGSENLLDNRPAMAPFSGGVLAVYSGDDRQNTQGRKQDDLFAAVLTLPRNAGEPELVEDEAPGEATLSPVHPNETEDVARMREYRIASGGKDLRLLRGEFHRHTEFTAHRDGDGLLEDSFRYALDAGNLDWMGNGDHDNGIHHEYMWWLIQKVTDLHNNPPRFVGTHTYERSNRYPNGHRNVMMPKRGIRPLPRGELMGTEEKGTPDTKILYAYLKHFGGICASHTSGTDMGTDWRDSDPVVEPIVEIYQGHRHNYEHLGAPRSATEETHIGGYQPKGTVWNAFEKGIRMGFQASSDHISTHMSYAVVLTDDASRQGLIDAFKKRHCYAATDNIILDVRSGEHLMGDAFETARRPSLEITIHGTGPIAKVHIIRDNKYVYSAEPKEREVKLRYTDMDAAEGKTSYYYVRVEQADGNLAWGSPVWITYKP